MASTVSAHRLGGSREHGGPALRSPEEHWGARIDQLLAYQVNSAVLGATGNSDVKFMHCLPTLHNRETGIGRRHAKHRTA